MDSDEKTPGEIYVTTTEQPGDCPLVLYNPFTRRRELFRSRVPGEVKLFTCGPSVYRRPHLGNYRTFLYEDVLQRYLEYRGYRVKRVIVVTDVEDKAIEEAVALGHTVQELTDKNVDFFRKECERLGIELPDVMPRASTSVDVAAELIGKLLERGVAYRHNGDVFYDPLKYPGFGQLFGLDMSDWPTERRRFSQDTYEGNRWNRGDFILWHARKPGDHVFWETPLGTGRPSWNVQDPAMCVQQLGYEIDIHCGGIDNLYRHHDYNRAVIEGITGREFCHYWLHGEHVIVDGAKMSKSKGNVLYLEQMAERGISAREVRFLLIYGYYRDKLNITDDLIDERVAKIRALRSNVALLLGERNEPAANGTGAAAGAVGVDTAAPGTAGPGTAGPGAANAPGAATPAVGGRSNAQRISALIDEIPLLFETAMNNDLHVADAVNAVATALNELRAAGEDHALPPAQAARLRATLTAIDSVLQCIFV